MDPKSVLQKSVALAEKNNWNFFGFKSKEGFKWWVGNRPGYKEAPVLFISTKEFGVWDYRPVEVIYNHDFAKALWGEYKKMNFSPKAKKLIADLKIEPWQYHLQQMIVADDAFAYLAKNLK